MKLPPIVLRLYHLLQKPYIPPLALLFIAAICYLPLAGQLGYYNDDWYLMYAGTSQGAAKFLEVFEIDRPLRGYLVGWLFEWFGTNALLYSLSGFVVRVVGAWGLQGLLRRVWPSAPVAAWLAALWWVIYPGFLDQPNAIDYQSHLVSFTLAIFSIDFSIRALYTRHWWGKAGWISLAVLLQLAYLGLMEYYIGLEGLRFLLIGYIMWQRSTGRWWRRLRALILPALPALLTAGAFLVWRIFIFDAERKATNVGSMFADMAGSPILRILWMLVLQVQDFLNTVIIAWFEPVYRLAATLRLKYTLEMFAWAAAALVLFTLAVLSHEGKHNPEPANPVSPTRERDLIWLGILGVICALVPIHLGDRQIIFKDFGRFSLPGSIGAVMFLAGLWQLKPKARWHWIMPAAMVFLASLTHYANARMHVENWETVKEFWWQVSWRIPQVEPQTVLVANYPDQGIAEDYFVWGPANLIYYPTIPAARSSPLTLLGATLELRDIQAIQAGMITQVDRRGFSGQVDPSQTLVLSMPSSYSCVHVLDGTRAEISIYDRAEVALVAPYSRLDVIHVDATATNPALELFGQEPAHNWCYYYQRASLARQRGDWAEIVRLGDEARQLDLRPTDWVEWMPFLLAYAYQGMDDRVDEISWVIEADSFLLEQACKHIQQDSQAASQHPQGYQLLIETMCMEP